MQWAQMLDEQRVAGVGDRRSAVGVRLVGLLYRRGAVGNRCAVELELQIGLELGESRLERRCRDPDVAVDRQLEQVAEPPRLVPLRA